MGTSKTSSLIRAVARWLIDGVTFLLTLFLILTACSYTKSYIHHKRITKEGGVNIISSLRKKAPTLVSCIEKNGKRTVLFFIDFSCPRCADFWKTAVSYEQRLADSYTFILIPESIDAGIPVANMFIDRFGVVKKTLHVDSSPSIAIIDPLSFNVETIEIGHRIIEWLERESLPKSSNNEVEENDSKGGDENKAQVFR